MSDILDPSGQIAAWLARQRRLAPVLNAMFVRYRAADPMRIEEVEVSQEEYDTLLDGEKLPAGQQLHFMGKPVVVRKGST